MPSYGSGENLFWRSWTQGQCLEVLRQPFNKPTPVTATELHRLFYFKESGDSISPNSVYTAAFRSISVLASCPCIQSSLIIYVIATSFLLLPPAFVPSLSQSFCVLKRALNLVSMKQVRGTWRRGGGVLLKHIPVLVTFFHFLTGERLILHYISRAHSQWYWEKHACQVSWQEMEAADRIKSTLRKQRKINAGAQCRFSFCSVWTPARRLPQPAFIHFGKQPESI